MAKKQKLNNEKCITPLSVISKFYDNNKPTDSMISPKYWTAWYKYYLYEPRAYSQVAKKMTWYGEKKCVFACVQDLFGAIFIMRTERGYSAFSVKSKIIGRKYDFGLVNMELKDALDFIEDNPKHSVILNDGLLNDLKKRLIVEALRRTNGK